MEQIVEQLIKLNERDVFDVVGILLPIILTVVLLIQNKIYAQRNDKLQRQISNRDIVNQYRDNILSIYGTYYEFFDIIYSSGFSDNVRSGRTTL